MVKILGETGPYNGLWYASDAFVRYKTMSVVHKDVVAHVLKETEILIV